MIKKIMYGFGGLVLLLILIGSMGSSDSAAPANKTESREAVVEEMPIVANPVAAVDPEMTVTSPVSPNQTQTSDFTYHLVADVIDGDTIKISIDGKDETLRLIGLDTPETVDPRKPVQCFGKEASDKAKELLLGKRIRIESDDTQDTRDKYGRLLAYVYRDDGLFYNKNMIEEGYAYEYTYEVPYKYQSEFKAAETSAKVGQKGLWAPTACDGDAAAPVTASVSDSSSGTTNSTTNNSGNYYCSSDIYNCTDFQTQDEAQDVFLACGGINNDVHDFDRDKDGQACETLP